MTIDGPLISRLENLARLELSGEERQRLQKDLNDILFMVEKLQELDVSEVEPLTYVNEEVNFWRRDEVEGQTDTSRALKNAPAHDDTYFLVPKMIDK